MFQEREFLRQTGNDVIDFSMSDKRNEQSKYWPFFVTERDYRRGGVLNKLGAATTFIHSKEAVRKFSELIDLTQPDLVHCHNIYHQLTPSIIRIAKAKGVPVVLTVHDYKTVCPVYTRLNSEGEPCSDCLKGSFIPVLKNRCAEGSLGKSGLFFAEAVIQRWLASYEKVDRFIVPSRFMRDSIAHRFPKERVTLLYNGVDIGSAEACREDDGYVLYLGRLSHEKGIQTLLRAHEDAKGAWRLLVAGTGPLLESQKRHPSVKYLGHLSGSCLKNTLARSAVVVAPSEWYENCPMSILDAMAYGKPVVASRMGGIPELVDDGQTGMLFEAGNATQLRECVDRLMMDPAQRIMMGQKARAKVEQEFSLGRHYAGLMGVYLSVLDNHQEAEREKRQ